MADVIREQIFESNSSETHSFSIVSREGYTKWKEGGYYIRIEVCEDYCATWYKIWSKYFDVFDCPPTDEQILYSLTKEQIKPLNECDKDNLYTPAQAKRWFETQEQQYEYYKDAIALLDRVIKGEIPYDDPEVEKVLCDGGIGGEGFYTPLSLQKYARIDHQTLIDDEILYFWDNDGNEYDPFNRVGFMGRLG